MHFIFIIFLFLINFLHASDDWICDQDDPAIVHHVNIITGQLNLNIQDAVINGAEPLFLNRTYSSFGALVPRHQDKSHTILSGEITQGGWNFFPHLHLRTHYKRPSKRKYQPQLIELSRENGSYMRYIMKSHSAKIKGPEFVSDRILFNSGSFNGRTDPNKNQMRFNLDNNEIVLSLPNGSERYYKFLRKSKSIETMEYHALTSEILPSGRKILYTYDADHKLRTIQATNPRGDKVYSSIHFDFVRTKKPVQIELTTSDEKHFHYKTMHHIGCEYLSDVESSIYPSQHIGYIPRKSLGARVETLQTGDHVPLVIKYYKDSGSKDPEVFRSPMDKVKEIKMPLGEEGAMVAVARFFYTDRISNSSPSVTRMRDVENILTSYNHENNQIKAINYFDQHEKIHHYTIYDYQHNYLTAIKIYDQNNQLISLSNLHRDADGNIVTLNQNGQIKRYTYLPRFNVPTSLEIEGGPTYRYSYKEGTDLVTKKETYDGSHLLISEIFTYNDDHILIEERVESGSTCKIKSYEIDDSLGLPILITESYLENSSEVKLQSRRLAYSPARLISVEEVYDAEDRYRYTIYTDYNAVGGVVRKTTPLGGENFYSYDSYGRLVTSHEVGSSPIYYTYDKAGRCTTTEQNAKVSRTRYDCKSRPISKTDFQGHTTSFVYDAFNHLIETRFPDGSTTSATYDVLGNTTSTTDQNGRTTHINYNVQNQPILITAPDGSTTRHFYNEVGTLAKTLEPDGLQIHYQYDILGRMLSKQLKDDQIISEELWSYNNTQMISHTQPSGLTTTYSYDGAGRLIEEDCAGRYKRYHYDAMGLVDWISNGEITQHKRYDLEGRVVEEWEGDEPRENYTQFFYNGDGRKESALRQTSQGEARDYFKYDAEGRLIEHTDPYGAITQILYDDFASSKTVVNPIGNSTTETYDAMNRLILVEKRGPDGLDGVLLFEERYEYDFAGNKIAQRSMGHSIAWEYDCMNRVTQEIEADQKITRYAYDISGNIIKRTLPSGIEIDYSYDKIGHLLSCKSEGIDYQYRYDLAGNPISITDHSTGKTLHRSYNLFGEITSETNPAGITLRWEYNPFGRCTRFTLPDSSTISYRYKQGRMQTISRDGKYEHCYTAFDPNGHVQSEELIYNLGTLDSFRDLLERATAQSSTWLTHSFTYGLSGLVTSRKNSIFGDISYSHDGLNQLCAEGDKEHHFDPLGNPEDAEVNSLNQILTRSGLAIVYDGDGNPLRRGSTQYFYDALSRLTRILYEDGREVHYSYDPLNRLLSNTADGTTIYYLYDKEFEIGTLNRDQQITHLKVLGLGIRGDIGAGVAIETPAGTFAPLHDLRGNIIALIDREGALAETYDIEAFGDEILPKPSPISPWRFSSKRSEESLIFFGLRFYDPILGRFLTPDPSGFADGPNLYSYVRSNPMNRLDLFGLLSDGVGVYYPFKNQVFSDHKEIFSCGANAYGNDFIMGLSTIHFNHFQPAAGSIREGQVHINQLIEFAHPLFKTPMIAMSLAMNGIMNTEPKFREFCANTYNHNEGLPFLGIYNPTSGKMGMDVFTTLYAGVVLEKPIIFPSLYGLCRSYRREETDVVAAMRGVVTSVISYLNENNPHARILMTTHSGGGSQWSAAYHRMDKKMQQLCAERMYCIGVAAATPFPENAAIYATNLYSKKDYATGLFVDNFYSINPAYDIKMLDCIEEELLPVIGDHAYNSRTYQVAYGGSLDIIKRGCPIYDSR